MLAEGNIVKGTVVRLEEFGAFVDVPLAEGSDRIVTGLVHVSEVSSEYVENIYAYLTDGQEVEVKVLALKDDGKVDLSIKQADPDYEEEPPPIKRGRIDKDFDRRLRRFMHNSQMIQGEARRQKEDRR